MDIRLIATDLDGTLLDADGRIPPYTQKTIRDCLSRGIAFAIVSGRCFESARMPARANDLNVFIASANGARIDRSPFGPTIYERLMTEEECAAAYGVLRDCPGNIFSYVRGRNFCRRRPSEFKPAEMVLRGEAGYRVKWIYDDVEWMEREGLRDVHKFEIYDADSAMLADYANRLRGLGLAVTSSNPIDIEIQPADSTKGAAVSHLAKLLGISVDQTMAFGDNTNDLSMIEAAGVGVAMENAAPELKAFASRIAKPHSAEGEARLIRELVFGEEDRWPEMPD